MKASIGRIIIVRGGSAASNGADRAPAIITRLWSEDTDTRNGPVLVNATAFSDLATPQLIGSVKLYDTEADAPADDGSAVAFWPERV